MRALTSKQEAFCLAYVETGSATEAYRRAYNTSTRNDNTLWRSAKEVIDNPKVAARIVELREPAAAKAKMTVEGHLCELERLRDLAMAAGQYSAAIKAEQARGAVSGFYVQRQEIGGRDGAPLVPPSIYVLAPGQKPEIDTCGVTAKAD